MSSLASRCLRQTFRLSRPMLVVRNFTASEPVMKDIVQELYIKELKSYKPTQAAPDLEVGKVKKLHLPDAPKLPKVDEDISSELTAYEDGDFTPLEQTVLTENLEKQLLIEEIEEVAHAPH